MISSFIGHLLYSFCIAVADEKHYFQVSNLKYLNLISTMDQKGCFVFLILTDLKSSIAISKFHLLSISLMSTGSGLVTKTESFLKTRRSPLKTDFLSLFISFKSNPGHLKQFHSKFGHLWFMSFFTKRSNEVSEH